MYELVQVAENTFYMDSPTKIGMVRVSDDEVVFVDAGSDRDAGRRAKKILEEQNWKLRAIYVTHSHADHIGGARYLQDNCGCKVYAYEAEADATNHPLFGPFCTYGAYFPKEMRHKYTLAQESKCDMITDDNSAELLPEGWELVKLHGHSYHQVGFRTPDDVVFLADSLSSPETIEKYGICYIYDYVMYVETLEKIMTMEAGYFVPAHAPAGNAEEIHRMAELNIADVKEKVQTILDICGEKGKTCEEVITAVFNHYGMKMTVLQHATAGSSIKSYLARMHDEGLLKSVITEDSRLVYRIPSADR